MTQILKQSTAADVLIGPFVDKTDAATAETGESPSVKLSKNGQTLAAKNDVTTPVHDADGYYNCELDATDTGTLGTLVLTVAASANALPVRHEFMVIPANAYDSLYAGSDTLNADVTQWLGTAAATPTTAGVPEVDVTFVSGTAQTAGDLGADTAAIKTKTDFLPSATAGAAGGVFISGTNSSLTITGTTTLSNGLLVNRSSANTSAIIATGNGTGHGISAVSGSGATGNGINASASSTNGHGINGSGAGTGIGVRGQGGATGRGISGIGGATSGAGIGGTGTAGNSEGILGVGQGSAAGVRGTAGATGNGILGVGGATSGAGIRGTGTAGNSQGIYGVGQGSGAGVQGLGGATGHGILGQGGTNGDGIKGALGGTGVDIRGNITGNITGTVDTVTTLTGHTPQTGDTFALANGASGFVATKAETALIVADTNELQTDWADGGRLDLLIDAIKVPTDKLAFTVANQVDANTKSINDATVVGDGNATPWDGA